MLIDWITVVTSAITGPGDLVRMLAARNDYAFVARSGRELLCQPGARRDEVRLVNLARNRWDLRVNVKTGAATGITAPWREVFDDNAGIIDRPPPRRFPVSVWKRPGGQWATVAEVLLAGGRAPEDANWCLGRRMVLARFDPTELERALPALARAVAGKYDPKTRRIEIDPSAFRAQALATVALRRADPRHEELPKAYADELLAFAMTRITNDELRYVYARPGNSVEITPVESAWPPEVRRYFDAKLDFIGGGSGSVANSIRESIDPGARPRVEFTSAGSVGLLIMKKGGTSQVGF